MSEIQTAQIVQLDQGGINARILAREVKVDFRRIEAASIKIPVRFTSAEGKRFFLRWFNSLQVNLHFISVIARTRLEHADIEKIEALVRTSLDTATDTLNQSLDGAEVLFKKHGVTSHATYDVVALEIQAGVMSSLGRRFLDVLCKFDQLMPLLQTLEIHEIISAQAVDLQRAGLKREVRNVANSTRRLAMGLRRRMNASFAVDSSTEDTDMTDATNPREDSEGVALAETGAAMQRDVITERVGVDETTQGDDGPVSFAGLDETGSSATRLPTTPSYTPEELRALLGGAPLSVVLADSDRTRAI